MKAKIIFLDIDGVLQNAKRFRLVNQDGSEKFDEDCVKALNFITDETGALIVVSSTWRILGLAKVSSMLRRAGVKGRIIGVTPTIETAKGDITLAVPRFREIQAFLAEEMDSEEEAPSYVILDDENDMGPLSGRHIRTIFATGLTWADATRAIAMLGSDGRAQHEREMKAPVMNAPGGLW